MIEEGRQSFLIINSAGNVASELLKTLEKNWDFKAKGNPDFYQLKKETFAVDDARALKAIAATKPLGARRVIIIEANFWGVEAQNALLKTLEEPNTNNYFFLLVRGENVLLRTVRSRLGRLNLVGKIGSLSSKGEDVKKFLKNNPEERLKYMASFLNHDSETKKSDLISFLNEIEEELAPLTSRSEVRGALKQIFRFRKYLETASPSIKMISEYFALNLPRI